MLLNSIDIMLLTDLDICAKYNSIGDIINAIVRKLNKKIDKYDNVFFYNLNNKKLNNLASLKI